jgi:hypothetical protein
MDHDFDNAVTVRGEVHVSKTRVAKSVEDLGMCSASTIVSFKGRSTTALAHALGEHNAALVDRLLIKGGSVSVSASCIVSATATPQLPADALALLLRHGTADHANGGNSPGQPLRNAARHGRPDLIRHLLLAGADANAVMFRGGASPLSVAAGGGSDGSWLAAHSLLKAAADPMTPPALPLAIQRGDGRMTALLLEHGATLFTGCSRIDGMLLALRRFMHHAFRVKLAHQQGRLAGITDAESALERATAVCAVLASGGGGYLPIWAPSASHPSCASVCGMHTYPGGALCPSWLFTSVVQPALLGEGGAVGGGALQEWPPLAHINSCTVCSPHSSGGCDPPPSGHRHGHGGCVDMLVTPPQWGAELALLDKLWGGLYAVQPWSRRKGVLLVVRGRKHSAGSGKHGMHRQAESKVATLAEGGRW